MPPPTPMNVVQYELGSIADARLTFTDAALAWDFSSATRPVLYSAAAEASPDAVDMDSHDHPAELLEVQLDGPWFGLRPSE